MATWTGNGPNSKTFVYNIKTGERSWQVDLNTKNHSEIKEMQQKLTGIGYSTQGADGTYGNNTKTAVINFQRANPACGTPDGYFGKNTLNTFVAKVGSLAGYNGTGGGGSDYTIPATIDTDKHGDGGTLNLRKSESSSADVVTTIPDGATIYVKSMSGTWLAAKYGNYTGYVMAMFVMGTTAYGDSGGSTTTSYTFSANNAVTYALNHSENSSGVACSKRNTTFTSIDGDDDCADFVHQCLCAGGVPMFNGWFFRLPSIPSSWSNSKWTVTYSGCQQLIAKGWLETVAFDAIQPGDIIYTYNKDATPTPYTHVTIAVSGNVTDQGKFGCKVCGYTTNQHDVFKELKATNCRCYRVKSTLPGDGTEKRVSLPLTGNGGYVL